MNDATLMVHLELGQPNTALLTLAADLAERLHASVMGVALCQPMRILYNDGYVPSEIIEQDRQQIDDDMKVAEAEFHAAMDSRVAGVEWRSVVTEQLLSAQLANEACRADLVITGVGRNGSIFDTSRHVDIGNFVMTAGRPCLVVPAEIKALSLGHVIIGWKDSAETRRAVFDALPVLKLADRVTVVTLAAEEDVAAARSRLRDVVGWLKRHGITANPVVSVSTGADAVGFSRFVEEERADLVVAGAYGHSRLREWVLGGVTRDVLLKADRCALVSH